MLFTIRESKLLVRTFKSSIYICKNKDFFGRRCAGFKRGVHTTTNLKFLYDKMTSQERILVYFKDDDQELRKANFTEVEYCVFTELIRLVSHGNQAQEKSQI